MPPTTLTVDYPMEEIMKYAMIALAFTLLPVSVSAQPLGSQLCRQDPITTAGDVLSNPQGYYIKSLGVEIKYGDPRIIPSASDQSFFCTRPAATPAMDDAAAAQQRHRQVVEYLFVPLSAHSGAGPMHSKSGT